MKNITFNDNQAKDNSDLLHDIRVSQLNSMIPKSGLLPSPPLSNKPNAPLLHTNHLNHPNNLNCNLIFY